MERLPLEWPVIMPQSMLGDLVAYLLLPLQQTKEANSGFQKIKGSAVPITPTRWFNSVIYLWW
ncbi:unnamed protein product [Gulo gulo]|uniref:Uncharacterized protein n=1 Tax=Gulo gulo TaxID=48420 RepID=A0A9X9Q399_GULGU|nr:unnamed protein product [Gulo gulo]